MKMGLIGALGGLGKGLHEMGKDIADRRERALAHAQAMAAEQRKSAERKAERADDKAHDLLTIDRQAGYKAAEGEADRTARKQERIEDRTYKVEDREDEQDHDTTTKAADRQAARDLARLKGTIDENNTRLAEQLDDGETQGVKYGDEHPNKPGWHRIIIVTKGGKLIHTTSWSKPKSDNDDDERSSTTLPPPTRPR